MSDMMNNKAAGHECTCGCGENCQCCSTSNPVEEEKKHSCTCAELHIGMYALLDRELTPAERNRLEEHIKECPECAARVAAEADLRKLLKKCCCGSAPKTLRDRITYSIRVERHTL